MESKGFLIHIQSQQMNGTQSTTDPDSLLLPNLAFPNTSQLSFADPPAISISSKSRTDKYRVIKTTAIQAETYFLIKPCHTFSSGLKSSKV